MPWTAEQKAARHQERKRDPEYRARRRAAVRAYEDRNPEQTTQIDSRGHSARRQRLKAEVVAAYGGACVCCDNDLLVHLAIDHVDGQPAPEHRKAGFYKWLKDNGFPDGFQVLCHNCNFAKHQLGSCPCQEEVV